MLNLFETSSAVISKCGSFRYELRRIWNDALPPYVSGMLNPSTADAELDDPTIRRNIQRARVMGFGSLIVWNLGAGRATEPRVWKSLADPIGPDNDLHIRRVLEECRDRNGLAVAGWGNHGSFMQRDEVVAQMANEIGVVFHCLGVTKFGHPKHPLYVAKSTDPVLWIRSDSRIN
ncbi:DUF1643 domain-containing protein [Tardiphaga sp. 804_B3_N1_9]|uniref:DUF1643 domain-containing protein n=1 Tax=Tardiphaga sp. 804_B3_N1_9 TaxID=3240786 RepID=UPI003F23539D